LNVWALVVLAVAAPHLAKAVAQAVVLIRPSRISR
jgi:hypothetical protein